MKLNNLILIAHRGNTAGPNEDLENSPPYLEKALSKGFHVEVDVWIKEGHFFLGHDRPRYPIDSDFLTRPKVWCHAKNLTALSSLLDLGAHCFWHQSDDGTLTSRGYIWTYPGKKLTDKSICVLPERISPLGEHPGACMGICSDWIKDYRENKI